MPEDEIDLLLVQADLRLKAARQLLKTGFYDDAVSRAYYSMYFAATAMFLAKGIKVKTHRGLVARFGREFVETGLIEAHFGRTLRIAEELRSEADYSIIRQISSEENCSHSRRCREVPGSGKGCNCWYKPWLKSRGPIETRQSR